jgi:hypothetical protein
MKIISFFTDWAVVDRIIDHLKLTFVAERPPPPQVAYQGVLMAARQPVNIFRNLLLPGGRGSVNFRRF